MLNVKYKMSSNTHGIHPQMLPEQKEKKNTWKQWQRPWDWQTYVRAALTQEAPSSSCPWPASLRPTLTRWCTQQTARSCTWASRGTVEVARGTCRRSRRTWRAQYATRSRRLKHITRKSRRSLILRHRNECKLVSFVRTEREAKSGYWRDLKSFGGRMG